MIVCPNCNHQNPDEALQCEACYTPLPTTTNCPNCGVAVQTDATFCGQCGFNLKPEVASLPDDVPETIVSSGKTPSNKANETKEEEMAAPTIQSMPANASELAIAASASEIEPKGTVPQHEFPVSSASESGLDSGPLRLPELPSQPLPSPPPPPKASSPPISSPSFPAAGGSAPTQLQIQTASLFHVQTQTRIELPYSVTVIHIGKPNEQIPPDIDVSGFPDSEIVSRIHADIRVEGDIFYVEDTGSSNGTYVNHTPLTLGNRHRLRSGDRIGLGKGDRVTFIFQLT
jgi:pSer/pThr/pTyr-binding forkhead associated (FHA) protein